MRRIPYRYRVLALLSIAASLAAYAGRGYWWVDAFAANIAAGFIGALATVVLVDRAAEQRQEEVRRRVERVALTQARKPLVQLTQLFADMLKASLHSTLAFAPLTLRELFQSSHLANLDWLNLYARCGGQPNSDLWLVRISRDVKQAADELSAVVDKYAAYLSADLIEAVETVRGAPFFTVLASLKAVQDWKQSMNDQRPLGLYGTEPQRDEFFQAFLGLCELFAQIRDESIPVPEFLFRVDIQPLLGSARLTVLPPRTVIGPIPPSEAGDIPYEAQPA